MVSLLSGAFQFSETRSGGPLAPRGLHQVAGAGTVFLLLWILCTVFSTPALRRLRGLAAGALFLCAIACFTFALPMLHAFVAQMLFATLACFALFTSPYWETPAEPLDKTSWESLPALAGVTPILVACQVFLGVAYRHRVLGVMPHLAGALLVSLAILGISLYLLQNFPEHRALHAAAVAAVTITGIQVGLGMVALMMALVGADTTLVAVLAVVAHVFTGALMLGASLLLAIQLRRSASATGV